MDQQKTEKSQPAIPLSPSPEEIARERSLNKEKLAARKDKRSAGSGVGAPLPPLLNRTASAGREGGSSGAGISPGGWQPQQMQDEQSLSPDGNVPPEMEQQRANRFNVLKALAQKIKSRDDKKKKEEDFKELLKKIRLIINILYTIVSIVLSLVLNVWFWIIITIGAAVAAIFGG